MLSMIPSLMLEKKLPSVQCIIKGEWEKKQRF